MKILVLQKVIILHLVLVMVFLTGCAITKRIYSEKELRGELSSRLTENELEELIIPTRITPDMRAFAQKETNGIHSYVRKATTLVERMISKWQLEYDQTAVMTAPEAFVNRRANCLGFTNLFVTLTRSIGMKTFFVDVPQAEEIYEENNIMIISGHICAGLYDGGQFYLIDFAPAPEKHYRIYQEIDDIQALAIYYNNIGYQISKDKKPENLKKAMDYYNLATKIYPGFVRGYNNKGVALSMLNLPDAANNAYQTALKFDPEMPEVNCNLGSLLYSQGNYQDALKYLSLAVAGRPKNGNYRYRLGLTYFMQNNLDDAKKEFKLALRHNKRYARAYLALGVIYSQESRFAESISNLEKAISLEPDMNEAKIYLHTNIARCVIRTI